MLIRKPLAIAFAALSFACAGNAAAGSGGEIELLSYSWGVDQPVSVGANRPLSVGGAKTESVGTQPGGDPPAARPLRNAPGGERYLEIKMQDAFVTSYQVGGSAKPPMEGGPQRLSAGERGATAMFNGFTNFGDIKGESTSGGAARVAPPQQVPPPVAPQRSPIADGARNALVVGGKLPHSAPTLAAPSARR